MYLPFDPVHNWKIYFDNNLIISQNNNLIVEERRINKIRFCNYLFATYSYGWVTEIFKLKSLCCYTINAPIIILPMEKDHDISQAHILILS